MPIVVVLGGAFARAQDTLPINLQSYINAGRVGTYFSSYVNGTNGMKITFRTAAYPFVSFNSPPQPLDWSQWDVIAMDVTNPESRQVKAQIRLDDSVLADGVNNCRAAWLTLQKGQTVTMVMPLRIVPMNYGMRALPPIPGTVWMADNRLPLNFSTIASWRLFLEYPGQDTRLTVRNVRLMRVGNLIQQFVDPFGQFVRADWPGKVHSQDELVQSDQTEADLLAKEQASAGGDNEIFGQSRDEYGGWEDGPTFTATGRFRTQQINGKWWFIDPLGKLFLSYGINSVDYTALTTIVTQREYMYSWLPSLSDPLSQHYSPVTGVFGGPIRDGIAYNFYSSNLQRKYGAEWEVQNHIRTVDRMKSWGFNTIGSFSDSDMWVMRRRIPYVAFTKIYGEHHRIPMGDGATMHDPFDPAFVADLNTSIQAVGPDPISDPYCLGWFIDNEPGWTAAQGEEGARYTLAYKVLAEPASTSAAKQIFLADLQAQYGTIDALNSAWGYNLSSWEELSGAINLSQLPSTATRRLDMRNFITKFARQYFQTVRDTLRSYDANALYLGCRFYRYSKEVLDTCAQFSDVISVNSYGNTVPLKFWYPDIAYLRKPFIVGEFHFGSTDRGMFHPGLAPAIDQRDRAQHYKDYVKSVLDNNAFIGCHWFQYVDQPVAGRMYDGENFGTGLVSVADIPYPELIQAAKEIHATGYLSRWSRR